MRRIRALSRAPALLLCLLLDAFAWPAAAQEFREISAEVLRDRIRGGLLGQILGNLNGLPHEMKYIDEPGNLTEYTPALPQGAWTDDDTDFEWVYIVEMQRANKLMLSPAEIARLWRERINRRIWCSNRYARHLMDLGLEPPLTGNVALNPWADFNISGQFLAETFALMAPLMPRTAARIALNYTRVAIDGEPAQTTQFFTAMIAAAFLQDDIDALLDVGVQAVAPRSRVREITADVRAWRRERGDDWRAVRRLIREKYGKYDGAMRDRNGYELNTAATVAALLYGAGDFRRTLLAAFNFGWDCDNNAATAGTILGVIKGYRWMLAQGWTIVDRYENRTRDGMPMDETITSFADRLIDLAENVIASKGGARTPVNGEPRYRIPLESPEPVVPLASPETSMETLRRTLGAEIESGLRSTEPVAKARAAYLAIALGAYESARRGDPAAWEQAIGALNEHWRLLQDIYWDAEIPGILPLRERAAAAGLRKPAAQKAVW